MVWKPSTKEAEDMRAMRFTVVAIAFMFTFGLVKTAQAEMVNLLGPVYIVKHLNDGTGGTPNDAGFVFRAPVPGKGVIIVRNGGDSGETARVSSARVELNNMEIAGESDFNKGVQQLSYDVDLKALNELKAVIRSCEKCEIEITVLGEAPPAVTAQEVLLQEFGRLP